MNPSTGAPENIKQSIDQVDNKYSAFKFSIPIQGEAGFSFPKGTEKIINLAGDHITVARLDTSAAIYIKLDSARNPWLRVLQGDVITRKFTKFYFRVADQTSSYAGITNFNVRRISGVFYISNGPLLTRRFRKVGIFPGNTQCKGNIVVDTTPRSLNSLVFSSSGQFAPNTVGSYGGEIIIKNTGFTTVWIDMSGFQTANPPTTNPNTPWFPILQGDTLTLDLGCVLQTSMIDATPTLATISGTGEIAAMVDAEMDLDFQPNFETLNGRDYFSIE